MFLQGVQKMYRKLKNDRKMVLYAMEDNPIQVPISQMGVTKYMLISRKNTLLVRNARLVLIEV